MTGLRGKGYRIISIIYFLYFQTCMCDTTPDSCKRCCRMNLNTSCFVMQPEEMLPDGTPCKTGFCNKGVCEPTMTDIVVRIWGFFEDFNLNSVMRFLKVRLFGICISFFLGYCSDFKNQLSHFQGH